MTFSSTIDWDAHWEREDRADLELRQLAGERMARRLARYFEPFPESLADVGCGPGFLLFELAETYRDREFVGYDAAPSVVRANRSVADEHGVENVRFRRGSLPEFDVERTFACVTCFSTLHYVAEPERALRRLLERVEPGGKLVFTYPNRHTQRAYRAGDGVDPERFGLVLAGENLLTYGAVERATGRRPRSFWKAVGEDDWRSIGQVHPCVVVEG